VEEGDADVCAEDLVGGCGKGDVRGLNQAFLFSKRVLSAQTATVRWCGVHGKIKRSVASAHATKVLSMYIVGLKCMSPWLKACYNKREKVSEKEDSQS
jgi:hypothetical protein